ncbi:hypothetical protein DSECCO2_611660 [anaerobic digester metagenome]
MKNNLMGLGSSLPSLVQNTRLNISLQGWPAAVAIIAICGAGVTIYFVKASHPEWDYSHMEVA